MGSRHPGHEPQSPPGRVAEGGRPERGTKGAQRVEEQARRWREMRQEEAERCAMREKADGSRLWFFGGALPGFRYPTGSYSEDINSADSYSVRCLFHKKNCAIRNTLPPGIAQRLMSGQNQFPGCHCFVESASRGVRIHGLDVLGVRTGRVLSSVQRAQPLICFR